MSSLLHNRSHRHFYSRVCCSMCFWLDSHRHKILDTSNRSHMILDKHSRNICKMDNSCRSICCILDSSYRKLLIYYSCNMGNQDHILKNKGLDNRKDRILARMNNMNLVSSCSSKILGYSLGRVYKLLEENNSKMVYMHTILVNLSSNKECICCTCSILKVKDSHRLFFKLDNPRARFCTMDIWEIQLLVKFMVLQRRLWIHLN